MKIWLRNGITLNNNNDKEVADFIRPFITCQLPDKKKNPRLYDLVDRFQRHKCTNSCQRVKRREKSGKAPPITMCRYGYPRKPSNTLKMNPAAKVDGVSTRVKSRRYGRINQLYQLPRNEQEIYLNAYNPVSFNKCFIFIYYNIQTVLQNCLKNFRQFCYFGKVTWIYRYLYYY